MAYYEGRGLWGPQRYRDDPTIVAWNLINEPRCVSPQCEKLIQAWVEDVAPFLKTMDPNHLVTIGTIPFPGPHFLLRLEHQRRIYTFLV